METKRHIPVTRPFLPEMTEFLPMLEEIWNSRILSNRGHFHEIYRENIQTFLGVKYAYPFVNGTVALETAIKSLGIQNQEIITTPFTYVATTLAITNTGNIPVFCDVKEDGCIDENLIRNLITEKTGAILPVHVYGNVCNVNGIQRIANEKDLYVIYDSAHALGVEFPLGTGIGNYGDISVFSTHATKTLNTFEGGLLTYENPEMDRIIKLSCNFGLDESYDLVYSGSNGKMNEIQAAMGLLQLKYYDKITESRKKITDIYIKNLEFPTLTPFNKADTKYNYIYHTILLENRNEVQEKLIRKGITTRKYFSPLVSETTLFRSITNHEKTPTAKSLADHILVIPLYAEMEEKEAYRVIKELKKIAIPYNLKNS